MGRWDLFGNNEDYDDNGRGRVELDRRSPLRAGGCLVTMYRGDRVGYLEVYLSLGIRATLLLNREYGRMSTMQAW